MVVHQQHFGIHHEADNSVSTKDGTVAEASVLDPSGTDTLTEVPFPGAVSRFNVAPSRSARSCMPYSPSPPCLVGPETARGSKPFPLSATMSTTCSSGNVRVRRLRVASAYFPLFVNASCAMR